MRQMTLINAWLILSAFILSGATCQRVNIADHELCGDKGELGASCFHMLSDENRKLTYEEWEQERFGQICMKADAYANIKAALLKLCESSRRCTWQEVQDIKNLGKKVSRFSQEAATCRVSR